MRLGQLCLPIVTQVVRLLPSHKDWEDRVLSFLMITLFFLKKIVFI